MSEHTLSWERLNDLMAENGRLDVEIDKLVDEKKALRLAAEPVAAALEHILHQTAHLSPRPNGHFAAWQALQLYREVVNR